VHRSDRWRSRSRHATREHFGGKSNCNFQGTRDYNMLLVRIVRFSLFVISFLFKIKGTPIPASISSFSLWSFLIRCKIQILRAAVFSFTSEKCHTHQKACLLLLYAEHVSLKITKNGNKSQLISDILSFDRHINMSHSMKHC
jgi:hypothetical protein